VLRHKDNAHCIVFKLTVKELKVPKRTPRLFTGTLLKNHSKNKYYHFYRFQFRLFCSSESLIIPFYTRALSCPTPILD
jgi:hypothetical protein